MIIGFSKLGIPKLCEYCQKPFEKVTEAIHNRLDVLELQVVSTGVIDININNNPDGVVFPRPTEKNG